MPFENPIVGGTALRIPAIQSPGYIPGSAGWIVRLDGSAEFNNVTIRGGTTISGIALYYNGTPALGNLIMSIAPQQGTDSYGNTYFAGVCTYDNAAGAFTQLLGTDLFTGRQQDAIADVAALGYTTLTTTERGTVPSSFLRSPTNGTYTYHGSVFATPGNDSTEANGPCVYVVEQHGGATAYGRISGAWIKTDDGGNAQTWQTPSYNTSWATSTTFNTTTNWHGLQYRIDAEDNLWLIGAFKATGAAGTTIFTLPSGYRPATQWPLYCQQNNAGTISAIGMEIGSSGNVNLLTHQGAVIANGNEWLVNGKIPLGNLS